MTNEQLEQSLIGPITSEEQYWAVRKFLESRGYNNFCYYHRKCPLYYPFFVFLEGGWSGVVYTHGKPVKFMIKGSSEVYFNLRVG